MKQLRRSGGLGGEEAQALERLETYTLRIEQYVEAMSSIQRLEQMPVCKKPVDISLLQSELEETGKLLAPSHRVRVLVEDDFALDISAQDGRTVQLDHGLFLTAAENLIGNAARFAEEELTISLVRKGNVLILTVEDDGPGYPAALLQNGPRPFAKMSGDAAHFGMGLYSGMLLCMKHGGTLTLQNGTERGASATASFAV